jgi:uncharacterized membrane protein (UPF0182 family)
MRLPGDANTSFLILQPFVPVSKDDKQQNLTAFVTASSDPDDYGTLQSFVTPPSQFIDGPAVAASRIQADPAITRELSLLNVQGSRVVRGNILVIPIEKSLLYVQPLYVKADQNPLPELKKVIVVSGSRTIMLDSLKLALAALTGAPAPETLEQQQGTGTPTPPAPAPGTPPTTPPADQTQQQLLAQAQAAFLAADAALKSGDLAAFQSKYNEGRQLLDQALGISGGTTGSDGTGGGSTTTTTAPAGSA